MRGLPTSDGVQLQLAGGHLGKALEKPRPQAPMEDDVFALEAIAKLDTHPQKADLVLGVYRDENGALWPLPAVRKAELAMVADNDISRHEYLPMKGDARFLTCARNLAFSAPHEELSESDCDRICSVQTISGTGALHVGARFVAETRSPGCVWISDPTWANHHPIWGAVGIEQKLYPYYDDESRGFDFPGMITALENAAVGDVVLLQACAQNPTGFDPSKDQWREIVQLCKRRGLYPFLDFAYQGFCSGDVGEDGWVVRFLLDEGVPFCVAQSFSKNFGLYGQRTGALHVVGKVAEMGCERTLTKLCSIIREEYSAAPRHGSTIVRTILESESLKKEWEEDLKIMTRRIKDMRKILSDELVRLGTPGSWNHIVKQNGMFSYTGLSEAHAIALRNDHHIYMASSGRAAMTGLTRENVFRVARAIDDVVRRTN